MDGAMDGRMRYERALLRIAALLVSLSLLAERAAGRSFTVRFLVLAILGRAEVIARAFVAGQTGMDWPFLDNPSATIGHPVDAAALALRLRLLAVILVDLVDAGCGSGGRQPLASVAPESVVPCTVLLLVFPSCPRPRPLDTS
ncbi:hypothetical protein RHIZO_02107 [Rhizobiaceae bacterium]|nr:hypothetical protein RHIZO_02107 [Rhizobiaceae bacterium]